MMSPTVMRGLSDVYGSCSTIWMLRRSLRSSAPRIAKMSRPLYRALPLVGGSSRISTCASVDLPQPDSPTTPSVSPLLQVERDAVDRAHLPDRCA